MNKRFTEIPNMGLWSQSIGGLVINFGIIEFQTLRWIERLGGEPAALKARTSPLSNRIKTAVALLPSSSLSQPDQSQACELWAEVGDHIKTRNRIAHNPICVGRNPDSQEAVLGVVDLSKMEPTRDNALEPLEYSKIASIALRVGAIGRELSAIIESLP